MELGRFRRLAVIGSVAVLAVGLAACSSSKSKSGTSGSTVASSGASAASNLPATVKIMSIRELTGAAAFAGTNAKKGIDLALDEIAAQKFLGATTLDVTTQDTAASVDQAVTIANTAINDSSYAAIMGPATSALAIAIAPLTQKAGIPIVDVQSGSDGFLIGNMEYRITPPTSSYYGIALTYLKNKGAKNIAILYNNGNPTLAQLGQTAVPALAAKAGLTVQSSDTVQATTQDFTAPASKIASANPDAVIDLMAGTQNPASITKLRQDGYKGFIMGTTSTGAGNLATAGATAAGTLWPTNFTATQTDPASQAFVKAYQAKYNELPNNYAAEGYDQMWFVARGLKAAAGASRAQVQAGLAKVATQGFSGAQGKLTFEANDVRAPGVIATWDGTKEVIAN